MNLDLSIKNMLANYHDAMPQIDKLREVLQQTALLGLARHHFFEHAIFYGGTALRILYGLDRYSEELDFSLIKPNPTFNFHPFLEGMHRELAGMGFQLEVAEQRRNMDSGIWSAFLKANTYSLLLSINGKGKPKGIHPDHKVQIKLEIDVDPPGSLLPLESKLVKNPVPFYLATYRIEDLFAGKMHAVLCRAWQNRVKGRDWYDLIWYIQNGYAVNLAHLKDRMKQTKHLESGEKFGLGELLKKLHAKIDLIDWSMAKADIVNFIADRSRLDIWSGQFFHDLVNQVKSIDSES